MNLDGDATKRCVGRPRSAQDSHPGLDRIQDQGLRVKALRHLDVPIDAAWAATTRPDAISTWFTECSPLSSRRFALRFTSDGDYVKIAEVMSWRRGDGWGRFQFALYDPGYPVSIVTVSVTSDPPRSSSVSIEHDRPPKELIAGYRTGWRDYLDLLADYVHGQTDSPSGTVEGE